ncbi:farnesyl diphosphate synthase [Mytilus galloprovincialis]|uniref:Farnesyl pyrophosphate synthase n=2 Tax=Mytilus galloprovincialis TaxID=29158 RepID=A0A8B6FP19_MYTGA|nr:farnesyl diphosphate synthase [Mytilus galloprovincialis]
MENNIVSFVSSQTNINTQIHVIMALNGHDETSQIPRKVQRLEPSELEQFDDLFPEIVNILHQRWSSDNKEITDALNWFKEVSEYNVPFGKKNRGISVVTTYKLLVKDFSNEDIKLARILGWCIEWLQAFFLVADDIMDKSITRRGKPCWYKQNNVGLIAVNDAIYLEACVYEILKHYFRKKPYYIDLVELFHQISMHTVMGQCLDLITSPIDGKVDFTKFTEERYNAIVKWKTAYYSFYLPVALAMYMAGITDEDVHSKAKTILIEMGTFFQIQDDYLDCFGDPSVIGKIGTDIQDNKCSWLVIQALKRVSKEQRTELQNNYGCDDPSKIEKVKDLFEQLDLQTVYSDYEENSFKLLMNLIDKNCDILPKEVFTSFAYKIYKRQK